jgi:hypothetical protein
MDGYRCIMLYDALADSLFHALPTLSHQYSLSNSADAFALTLAGVQDIF